MQRWIVVGGLVLMLLFGGAIYAYSNYKQGRPHPVWVPLPINPEVPEEKRLEIATNLKTKLSSDEVLIQVSKDLGLPAKMELSSDAEAADKIRNRLFVDVGEMESPRGRVPSINIGVKGKAREHKLSGEISMRLMEDVWKILGIKPPPKKS
ncbi:MAG: hypothetical protein EOP88_03335 [Verrucomicrobiaceae bacterium]|nr:MAG: hypothetical protein EOP88_03335 [Verrucomicrobiaceae bacterium]